MPYDRILACEYARKWAFSRNPAFYNFDPIGGDCTNFVSQCLYAGAHVMNMTPTFGWYYLSLNRRSPSWTGVEYLYRFLVGNTGAGPYGEQRPLSFAQPGDIIQLSFDGIHYHHSLFVVQVGTPPTPNNVLVATHTMDSYNRPLSSWAFTAFRLIHISGVRP